MRPILWKLRMKNRCYKPKSKNLKRPNNNLKRSLRITILKLGCWTNHQESLTSMCFTPSHNTLIKHVLHPHLPDFIQMAIKGNTSQCSPRWKHTMKSCKHLVASSRIFSNRSFWSLSNSIHFFSSDEFSRKVTIIDFICFFLHCYLSIKGF